MAKTDISRRSFLGLSGAAIAGAAVLTQIQGIVSDQTGSIMAAYVVPAVAFAVIAYYGFFIARKQELTTK